MECWVFSKADWGMFEHLSDIGMNQINVNKDVEVLNDSMSRVITETAKQSILERSGLKKKKLVPWWTAECKQAIKSRNAAFKELKLNYELQ